MMRQKKLIRYDSGLAGLAVTCMLTGALIAKPGEFTPGSTEIDEELILHQMETEIGLKRSENRSNEKGKRTGKEKPPDPHLYRLKAMQIDGTSLFGNAHLSQNNLTLRVESPEGTPLEEELQIPVQKIRRIEIKSWKIARVLQTGPRAFRVFYVPGTCIVSDNTGRSYTGTINARDWLQIPLADSVLTTHLRSYYSVNVAAASPEAARQMALKKDERPPDLTSTLLFISDSQSTEYLNDENKSASRDH